METDPTVVAKRPACLCCTYVHTRPAIINICCFQRRDSRTATRPITVIAQTLLPPLENDLSRIVLETGFIGASRGEIIENSPWDYENPTCLQTVAFAHPQIYSIFIDDPRLFLLSFFIFSETTRSPAYVHHVRFNEKRCFLCLQISSRMDLATGSLVTIIARRRVTAIGKWRSTP